LTIFRAVDVSFSRDGIEIVSPFSLEVAAGTDARLAQPNPRAASVAARMCAAIVKPTHGVVYVGDFETRLQPPQAKRLVGFVDARGFEGDDHALRCEVAFRADVWNLDKAAAQARATAVLAALGKEHAAYERAIALALVADVALVVLDQPSAKAVRRVRSIVPDAAIIATVASRT
jgi:ABC-type Na+ transport system ATPase subunit NatA